LAMQPMQPGLPRKMEFSRVKIQISPA